MSVLDALIFQTMPMGEPYPSWPPHISVQIPSAGSAPPVAGTKAFVQASPLFARRRPVSSGDVTWPAYCGLLKDSGIPLQANFAEVESLSDVNVPLRTLRRGYDEGFDLVDLTSADTVLIDCVSSVSGHKYSRLPLEIAGWHELKLLIESLRPVVGSGTPIGIGITAGDVYTDVSNALAARVDYVVLEFAEHTSASAAALNHLAWSVVAARNACVHSGSPTFSIFVDAPLANFDHMIKLLALGASAVCIDTVAASVSPTAAASANLPAPKGLLSGIGTLPVKVVPDIQPLVTKIDELLARLRARLYQQQLSSLSQLSRDHLRALDDQAARLCAVKMLEHE